MTTPLQTNRALLEIPERLEQLQVGVTPTTAADEPVAANVLNPTLIGNLNNSISSISSLPSSDEIIIRQRGRRRISLTWSPDKYALSNSFSPTQRTPTKGNSSIVLRSSPRKRLVLSESCIDSNLKQSNGSSLWKNSSYNSDGSPLLKRMRFESTSIAQMNTDVPLPLILKGLSQDQLIEIIANVTRIEPRLEEKIRHELPFPDLSFFENQLMHIKKNIFKSLPSSRLSQRTDSAAYSRAATHLAEFKTSIIVHCRILNESKHWDALIDYVDIAWRCVRSTPIWDNHSHNGVRRHCFKVLSCHCTSALRYGGINLGQERLNSLSQNLNDMSRDFEDIKSCSKMIIKILSKA